MIENNSKNLFISCYISCYSAPIKDIQKRIKEIDSKKNNLEGPSFISKKLRRLADIPEPRKIDNKLEEIEKRIKQVEESTDKHFQLLMEKLNSLQSNYHT